MGKKKARKKAAKKKAETENPKPVVRIIMPDGRCLDDLSPKEQGKALARWIFGDKIELDEEGRPIVRQPFIAREVARQRGETVEPPMPAEPRKKNKARLSQRAARLEVRLDELQTKLDELEAKQDD